MSTQKFTNMASVNHLSQATGALEAIESTARAAAHRADRSMWTDLEAFEEIMATCKAGANQYATRARNEGVHLYGSPAPVFLIFIGAILLAGLLLAFGFELLL